MPPQPRARLDSEDGFTLIEFMVAALIMTLVLGGTVTLATQMQQSYVTQLNNAEVEQEARYALDWIARELRSAGSDPYFIIPDDQEIWIDPDGGGDNDTVRLQSDISSPDLADGADGALDGDGENVTIALEDLGADGVGAITREDENADDSSALPMTEEIFTNLQFTFLNSGRVVTTNPQLVAYIQVEVTARSRVPNPNTGFATVTLDTEVRLRTR